MLYIVKKRDGVWVVDADGAYLSFENYTAAIDTARGAAEVFKRSKILSNQAACLIDRAEPLVRHPLQLPRAGGSAVER